MNERAVFSQQTLDFLLENRVMDSKAWFLEHRGIYERTVLAPMRALVEALAPTMQAIDPTLICEPKVGRSISRIYRDTRFTRSKAIFRENMWCVFIRAKHTYFALPGFYFEVNPAGFVYGCGFYGMSTDTMESVRRLILAGDAHWQQALAAYQAQDVFLLDDARYKRSRHPDQPEELRAWLDQRNIDLSCSSGELELLFSPELGGRVASDFLRIAPIYHFLMHAEEQTDHRPVRRAYR